MDSDTDSKQDIDEKLFLFDLVSDSEIQEAQECSNCIKEQKYLLLYSLLKADTENFYQLLEHPKIISDLKDFARKQWVEIATGRSIKFTSGLAQPSLDLQPNEICIPYLKEGEEIIVTRSPLINSNGVITLKNKHLSQTLSGCVYINPKTAMDNMQCDFDGDLLAFAPSKEFPILAEEVKQKNLPQNRYPDIVKKTKVPYQGTFAEIAVSAMDNKIGVIASEIQKNIALQCEVGAMPQSEKSNYIKGKKLGTIDASSPHLLAGCEAVATIISPTSTSVVVSSLKKPDHKLQIDNVNKYAFKSHQWQGETANITLVVEKNTPTVFAKIDNQVLGNVNKKSVIFLQEKLTAVGKSIQGFSFSGTLKNARASYADIVIDPNSVKFPQIEITLQQHGETSVESNKNVCTVLFFEASVDSALEQKTQQMMCNMLKRAVERAVESGYDTVQFVDVSANPDKSSASVRAINQLAAEYENINVDFIGSASVEDAMQMMKQPSDIVIGVKSAQTVGIIDFLANQGSVIAAYIPQTQEFDRRNLPLPKKTIEVARNNALEER
ncbi:hypothetical protein [Rivularia sp. UHCC 0363]|uniref:hypothetical protein n=1 Tax=Rivularia sp. UHCC 0363 TaxID=3110244 RepID=UPI002B22131D|nr:hypothetical protein [Rivularia sp. UHCC 0363]MEA5596826.1 hypothetical protein [Rivularia sp. UHCC 0363]